MQKHHAKGKKLDTRTYSLNESTYTIFRIDRSKGKESRLVIARG